MVLVKVMLAIPEQHVFTSLFVRSEPVTLNIIKTLKFLPKKQKQYSFVSAETKQKC